MRIIAFINEAGDVRKILDHIGESAQPPRIAPARPVGHFKIPHLWPVKIPQAGRADYELVKLF
jgi:hypothetical protein